MNATVFVVDDDDAVRDAVVRLLAANRLPARAYASAEAFLAEIRPGQPGCLLLDVRMPGLSGPELQAELAARGVDLPIVFLTGHGDVRTSVQAMKAGALDFLEKPVLGALLVERVRAALSVAAERRRVAEARARVRARFDRLSAREREVAELVLDGLSNKEIARRLFISHRTVEVHRAHIMQKLGAETLLELARLADAGDLKETQRAKAATSGDRPR